MVFYKAVILIAGPQKGTRFRPLSLDVPKPLFPVAGIPIIQHHIEALAGVDGVKEVLLLGFYPVSEMSDFVDEMNQTQPNLSVRYLQEFTALGTAGGLYHFRDQIRAGNPDAFFVLNGDVCAEFPLTEMLKFHQMVENTMVLCFIID
jgi:mannose-1-phosphate guanylyltransferase